MTEAPTLTGQDIAEAQGAVRGLLDRILDGSGSTSNDYVALRVLAARGPWASADALCDFLAGQPQLGLDLPAVVKLVNGLKARGLITISSPEGPGSVQLSADGAALHASLARSITATTSELYARIDPGDLATAHVVLRQVIERADRLSRNPGPSGSAPSVPAP